MPRKKQTDEDRAKIAVCINCEVPVENCNPDSVGCPYVKKYGKNDPGPAAMVQHSCGHEPEEMYGFFGDLLRAGARVEKEMKYKNKYHARGHAAKGAKAMRKKQ